MLQAEQVLQERYQLQRQLGRTAAGRQTWLAKDLQSNEQVTLKLLAFSPQMQWEELKLFEREAQVLQALDHPRIPRYRDYFSLDQQTGAGIPWFGLVQDYIPGFSLQELLEQGKRFSEKQVRGIATEILKILIYLHELSPPVLHRFAKNYFELERQILSFSYGKQKLDIRKIVGILLQKEGEIYQVNIRSYYKNSHYKNYRLGGALGEHESAWLAQEIQDWLNLR